MRFVSNSPAWLQSGTVKTELHEELTGATPVRNGGKFLSWLRNWLGWPRSKPGWTQSLPGWTQSSQGQLEYSGVNSEPTPAGHAMQKTILIVPFLLMNMHRIFSVGVLPAWSFLIMVCVIQACFTLCFSSFDSFLKFSCSVLVLDFSPPSSF